MLSKRKDKEAEFQLCSLLVKPYSGTEERKHDPLYCQEVLTDVEICYAPLQVNSSYT